MTELITLQSNERLTETVERENDDKIVVTHKLLRTPKYGDIDEYVAWQRETTYVQNSGELVVHTHSESYNYTTGSLETVGKDPITHTFELADDNETVTHDSRTWNKYAVERSRELVNTRWKNHRKGTNSKTAKEIVKEQIETQL